MEMVFLRDWGLLGRDGEGLTLVWLRLGFN